jgi:hypothetical protein
MICFIVAYFTLNGQDALTTQQLIQESRHFCFFFKLKIKSISRSGKFKCANGKIKFTKKKKKKIKIQFHFDNNIKQLGTSFLQALL